LKKTDVLLVQITLTTGGIRKQKSTRVIVLERLSSGFDNYKMKKYTLVKAFFSLGVTSILLTAFLLICLSKSFAQNMEMASLLITDNFTCMNNSECCERGIQLGELKIPLLHIKGTRINDSIVLEGQIDFSEGNIYISIIVGQMLNNEICPIEIIGSPAESSGVFKVEVKPEQNTVLYFLALGYEPLVYNLSLTN
jgi:hypothetical protein